MKETLLEGLLSCRSKHNKSSLASLERSDTPICARMFVTGEVVGGGGWGIRCARSPVTMGWMDNSMGLGTRHEVLAKLRRRYAVAGRKHRQKLIDQAVGLLGYHRKSAIRALAVGEVVRTPRVNLGRPAVYKAGVLTPWLRPIWQATDYACGRRLAAMLPEWIPAYEAHERRMPEEVRERLLVASARTLDRLLEPLRAQAGRRSLTRPGTLLRQQIPIRGSVWEEGKAGWLEVDTVALCGGSTSGEYVWVLDGVDYEMDPVFRALDDFVWVGGALALRVGGASGRMTAPGDPLEKPRDKPLEGLLQWATRGWLRAISGGFRVAEGNPRLGRPSPSPTVHLRRACGCFLAGGAVAGPTTYPHKVTRRQDQRVDARALRAVAELLPRESEAGAEGAAGGALVEDIRGAENAVGAGAGERGGDG